MRSSALSVFGYSDIGSGNSAFNKKKNLGQRILSNSYYIISWRNEYIIFARTAAASVRHAVYSTSYCINYYSSSSGMLGRVNVTARLGRGREGRAPEGRKRFRPLVGSCNTIEVSRKSVEWSEFSHPTSFHPNGRWGWGGGGRWGVGRDVVD